MELELLLLILFFGVNFILLSPYINMNKMTFNYLCRFEQMLLVSKL